MTRAMKARMAMLAICASALWQIPARADDAAAKTWSGKCAACHAADGSGNVAAGKALKVKDMRDPEIQKMSDADLTMVIAKGKDKMPGYEKTLKTDEIKGLVAYVRDLAKK